MTAPRIAVVGIGAIGGAIAARLAHAGFDPTLVARPATAAAIETNGLRVVDADGTTVCSARPRVVRDPGEAGAHDIVLLAVKSHAGPALAPRLAPVLARDAIVVPLVNGLPWWYFAPGEQSGLRSGPFEPVDPGAVQWNAIGWQRVVGAVVYDNAHASGPGVVRQGTRRTYLFGPLERRDDADRPAQLAHLFTVAGLSGEVRDDIRFEVWRKLVRNLANGPAAALARLTIGELYAHRDGLALAARIVDEATAIARRLGIEGLEADRESALQASGSLAAHRPSMLQDVEAGRAAEIDAIVGAPVALAHAAGVPVPVLETLLALLRLLEANRSTQPR